MTRKLTRRWTLLAAGGAAMTAALATRAYTAPADEGRPDRIDINQFILTFEETFRTPLDVTSAGPSKWTAHTFWNGDFGAARFADPRPGFPFVTSPEGGKIIARRDKDGKWEAGLLSSLDSQGRGFKQAYGYFEARMKLPGGEGVWPAFWLGSQGNGAQATEIDVVEYYGGHTRLFSSAAHVWPKAKDVTYSVKSHWHTARASLNDQFHTYGVEIRPDVIVFYFDRVEYWRTPATPSSSEPMVILVNLAINPDPKKNLARTPNPSVLLIDYVRAYKNRAAHSP